MFEKVVEIICNYTDKSPDEIKGDTNLLTDLGLQSIDFVDMICDFEEEFDYEVPERDFRRLVTVDSIVIYIQEKE